MKPGNTTAGFSRLPPVNQAALALLAALGIALGVVLWPHWRNNPDLSHGILMPALFLLLLRDSRRGPARFIPTFYGLTLLVGSLLLAALLASVASGLYAASVGWSHNLVAFTLTGSFVLFLAAGLVVMASDRIRWVPFNWSALVAAGLWLLCAPLPPGTYSRLTVQLQLMISENVLRALHLLGIAAARQGNVIQLATTSVGVEEACSGVRSLVACVFTAAFFSAMLLRRPGPRAAVLLLAAPLALVMNFLRSLTLTLLANGGVNVAGAWHDLTGYAVLGLTALVLAGLAVKLEPAPRAAAVPRGRRQEEEGNTAEAPAAGRGPDWPARLLLGSLVAALALAGFFVARTRPAPRLDRPAPDVLALLPAQAEGWRVDTSADLYRFRDALRTDVLAQRIYSRDTEDGPQMVIVYVAYWRPGQSSVSLVASHTPDACWPGAGWTVVPLPVTRARLAMNDRTLADAEVRRFQSGDFPQNVWYWHLYDGRPLAHENPNSPRELLRLALRYGFQREGDQLFVRISSNQPWDALQREPFMQELFRRLAPLGL